MNAPRGSETAGGAWRNAAEVRRVELVISTLLRAGVVSSLAIVVAGLVLSFVHHAEYLSSPSELGRLTQPGAAFPHTLPDVLLSAAQRRGQGLVMVGLLLLIATPILRVAVSIVVFVHERDGTFVAITSIVLALLLASFLLGTGTP